MWDEIRLLREAPMEHLENQEALESLLLRLGLSGKESHEFPTELRSRCGRGLRVWQYPNQFARYLRWLRSSDAKTYVEVGADRGGSFIVTVEYLSRFTQLNSAVAIDVEDCPELMDYCATSSVCQFIRGQSEDALPSVLPADLVLIDGDHSESACRSDFEAAHGRARIIALHDVQSSVCPGVASVWAQIQAEYAEQYEFLEFVQQYREVVRRTGQSFMGFGLAIRVGFIAS